LDLEAAAQGRTGAHVHEAVRVCEKLRFTLTRFAGSDGFASLLQRAVALARAEVPSLRSVNIKSDGTIQGLEDLAADAGNDDPGVAIIAHLLGLLVTFIGESLTLRLIRDAWPDASLDESQRE
jgi:hypothetical protein